MFGKILAMDDETIIQMFVDCTELPMDEIEKIKHELNSGKNPKEVKLRLAHEIVKMYHGDKKANEAREHFENTFSKGEFPEDAKIIEVSKDSKLIDVLVEEGTIESKSEARRLFDAGAVTDFPDKKITDPNQIVGDKERKMKIGKKLFIVLRPK